MPPTRRQQARRIRKTLPPTSPVACSRGDQSPPRRSPTSGKEAKSLEDVQVGLYNHQDDVLNTYDDTDQLRFETALPELRALGPREVARRTGHSLGSVHAVLAGRSQPRPAARARYIQAAALLMLYKAQETQMPAKAPAAPTTHGGQGRARAPL